MFKTARPVSICHRERIDKLANRRWAYIILVKMTDWYRRQAVLKTFPSPKNFEQGWSEVNVDPAEIFSFLQQNKNAFKNLLQLLAMYQYLLHIKDRDRKTNQTEVEISWLARKKMLSMKQKILWITIIKVRKLQLQIVFFLT